MHINKINEKKYIGITSNDVNVRWKNGYGYSEKLPIGRAIRKYGWNNFEHVIVAEGLDEDTAKNLEISLIDENQTTDDRYGYNLTSGGDGISGFVHSEETKRKISEIAKDRNMSGENNPNYGKKWSNEQRERAGVAHRRENLTQETLKKMSDVAKERVGKFNPFYGKSHSDETKALLSKANSRPVDKYDLNMNYITTYRSIKDAGDKNSLTSAAISNCCRGESKTSGGYIWRYSDK